MKEGYLTAAFRKTAAQRFSDFVKAGLAGR